MKKTIKKTVKNKEIESLKEEIKSLKEMIFKPVTSNSGYWNIDWSEMYLGVQTKKTRKITLEEKIELIAEHLKINFEMKPEVDAHPILKVIKEKKSKK